MPGSFLPAWSTSVQDTISRWEKKGLVSSELAGALRNEAEAWERRSLRRFGQIVVAVTGAILLLIAVVVFLARAWPDLSPEARTGIIVLLGVVVHSLGSLLLGRGPDSGLARVLHASGLAVILSAFFYSEEAWADGSLGAVIVGLSALAVPVGLLPLALRKDPVSASVITAFSYPYLVVFLGRALSLAEEPIIWTLDGVAVLSILFLLAGLDKVKAEGEQDWRLAVLLVSLYAGLILVLLTGTVALDFQVEVVWALDAWLAVIVGATLWGIHWAPPRLRRSWYPRNLAFTMLLAPGLAFWTLKEALDASVWITGLGIGFLGAVGLAYALRREAGYLTVTSCLALVAAAWYLGAGVGEALGVAGALTFTAALLFWASSRVGRRGGETRGRGTPYDG